MDRAKKTATALHDARVLVQQIDADLIAAIAGLTAGDTEHARNASDRAHVQSEDLVKVIQQVIDRLDKKR